MIAHLLELNSLSRNLRKFSMNESHADRHLAVAMARYKNTQKGPSYENETITPAADPMAGHSVELAEMYYGRSGGPGSVSGKPS